MKRKTIPTEKFLNYLLEQIVCDRKTAQNLIDDGRSDLAEKWLASMRVREIDAMEVMMWSEGWAAHVFDYHNSRPKDSAKLLQRLNSEMIVRRGT